MATTFYLRNANIGVGAGGANLLAVPSRGTTATSITTGTTASGTWISMGYWATKPLVGFTLSGSVSMNLRARETNNNANASVGVRLYRFSNGSLSGSLGQISATTELTTTESARTASVTPTSTAFANGDILVMEVGIINIGTMGGGQSVVLFLDGPTAAASGDSYITITENVTFSRRATLTE